MPGFGRFDADRWFSTDPGSSICLVVRHAKSRFYRPVDGTDTGLMAFLSTFVPQKHMSYVHAVSIQEVAASIRHSGRPNGWIGDFEEKYGL